MAMNGIIDLRSDTVTEPTDEMRRAMASAPVGDDVYGEDPTINRLEEEGARLLGHEAALFLPSGTMANQVAILTHTRRGDEVLLDAESHIFWYETGGLSLLAGCQPMPIPSRGVLDPADVALALREPNIHFPRTRLLCLENTHNRHGGAVMTVEETEGLVAAARDAGLKVHLDGARIFNAAAALQVPASRLASPADSVMVSLSKGLSAPVGSLLAGSREFIAEARRYRKVLGGGMRQAGILAAAGLVALKEMTGRLVEDHHRARRIGAGLAEIPGLGVNPEAVVTNIVPVDLPREMTAEQGVDGMARHGVLVNAVGPGRVRMVTHRHISDEDVDAVLTAAAAAWAG